MSASMNLMNNIMDSIITDDLKKVLSQYDTFTVLEAREKIRCELSGHEMPCHVDALESYIKGKKFQKLLEKHRYQYETKHLAQSNKKGRGHQLFCTLTLRHINNTPTHIEKHIDGRRFKKALQKWEECQKTGEVYRPYKSKQSKNTSDTEVMSDDGIHGDQQDVDNLSDLYPGDEFEDSDMDAESETELKGQRLQPSTLEGDQSDSDYNLEEFENKSKNTSKSESVTVEKCASVKDLPTKKRKKKNEMQTKKKTKT